jgi:dolichol-phosphate mannosyltransferase
MYSSFISVVGLMAPDEKLVNKYLVNVHKVLRENFSDYEIILVNNRVFTDVKKVTAGLDKDIRKDVTVINLSKNTQHDNAIVSGLDRANGDYTVILDMELCDQAGLILEMYRKTQENNDVVYLKHRRRRIPSTRRIFYKLYYFILRHFSDLTLDIRTHKNRMISRRALNSILTMRENMRYMKGLYSLVGYRNTYIEADIPESKSRDTFGEQLRMAALAITSFTTLMSRVLLWIFILSLLFSIFIIISALRMKFYGVDLLGNVYDNTPPGYTFLVVLISLIFVVLTLIMYIQSIFLSGIYNEIKKRPIYIIESIQRI